jgi:hypothetical protein
LLWIGCKFEKWKWYTCNSPEVQIVVVFNKLLRQNRISLGSVTLGVVAAFAIMQLSGAMKGTFEVVFGKVRRGHEYWDYMKRTNNQINRAMTITAHTNQHGKRINPQLTVNSPVSLRMIRSP